MSLWTMSVSFHKSLRCIVGAPSNAWGTVGPYGGIVVCGAAKVLGAILVFLVWPRAPRLQGVLFVLLASKSLAAWRPFTSAVCDKSKIIARE